MLRAAIAATALAAIPSTAIPTATATPTATPTPTPTPTATPTPTPTPTATPTPTPTATPTEAAAEAAADVVVSRAAFRRAVEHAGKPLLLEGAGLFRWKRILAVYAAAHYVGDGAAGAPLDADVPRRLEIAYFVGIDGPDFGKAADELLRESFPPEVIAALRERLDRLHAAYVDVRPGDRYTLTYLPGRGTELALNGRALATVAGADFARAYFAIWLGERPIDRGLRDALLGG
jgi:hypothetical protein